MTAALEITDVSKRFAGTVALRGVTFSVEDGEIHALVGGNGSGKSTLVKILAGVYTGDHGSITRYETIECHDITPKLTHGLGLRFVHQNPGVFSNMTVAENIAFGQGFPTRGGRIQWRALRRRTQTLLDRYDIAGNPVTLLKDLRPADRTMVAIARALSDAEHDRELVLVLDEPTAALPAHEVDVLLAALRRCASAGQAIIYVTHRLDEVLSISQSVTVFRDGAVVVTRPTMGLSEDELIEHITGRPLQSLYPPPQARPTAPVSLRVSQLAGGPLSDVSFTAHEGEVVGIAGLLGSGRSELLRTLFGALPRTSGDVELDGQLAVVDNPAEAMNRGIAYIPEDRQRDGALETLSVRENLSAARLHAYWTGLRFDNRRERRDAQEAVGDFRVRTADVEQTFAELSGGNQQKVILGRWLVRSPRLLLLDEPTQGVDVGARADIYAVIRAAVAHGATVLLVSSDFEELAHACDRILVLRDGRIAAELNRADEELDAGRITDLVYSTAIAKR